MKKKLAIIGASYIQNPLILKAKEMGLETHVFAWAADDVGEKTADFFYPISITEKEKIREVCSGIGVDGICSIGSDLAVIAVNYVAERLGLTGNGPECTDRSTNKQRMRLAFEENGDPGPKSIAVDAAADLSGIALPYPLIVKPVDRSGSRGVCKVGNFRQLTAAVPIAVDLSFSKKAVIEEFAEGREYSVEYISWKGRHYFVAVTEKFTTGEPHFIETGHRQPAVLPHGDLACIKKTVEHALGSLRIENGASHSEVKLDPNGGIQIIEIGSRMGGDLIGSDLVPLSTGYDYVKAVIEIALGKEPEKPTGKSLRTAVVAYEMDGSVTDSSGRKGYRVYTV